MESNSDNQESDIKFTKVGEGFSVNRNDSFDDNAEETAFLATESRHTSDKELDAVDVTPPPFGRKRMLKNLVVVSGAFLFLFTSFQSLQNLQSSLNKEAGLGTVSLSVIYACGMLAGLLLPPLIISVLGCKWTLVGSMACYIVFMAANLYPVWATMIPASIVLGCGAASLWAAKCTYLTQLGAWYSVLDGSPKQGTISNFFGIFFMFFQSSQIWGNLISSAVFSQAAPDNSSVSEDVLATCGANYCPTDYRNNTNLDRPNTTKNKKNTFQSTGSTGTCNVLLKVYTVCGIYLGCGILALAIVAVLLDNISVRTDVSRAPVRHQLSAIARHFLSSRYQQLLIPLTVYSGVEQAFMAGDFTRSYISCVLGVWNVGYVMIAYGISDALGSLTVGRLVKHTGFVPWFVAVFILHGGSMVTLLLWQPSPDHVAVFYLIAVCWGAGDAIIQTLVNALYGSLFTEKPETAFASYRICESAGFILCFGYSAYICTRAKLVITLLFLVVGSALYGVLEWNQRKSHRK
ncbi:UN93A-like protein [Mya arenaria]|uniref:UN93A-like protein n=1 Tax=Mya arenaria TaxID=6604 RepID=A0ABY7DHU8_MYAAR|nr:UN93A-like protein [Mya arenaria]